MIPALRAAALVAAACCLLQGCASRGPLIQPSTRVVELSDTPFYPQTQYQCGPAALATVLGASGIATTPEALESQVYVPSRRGSLTIEMQAAPRRHERIAYPLAPDLDAITAELDTGRPVLVLHNYGLPFWPRWHYAVVIGYDAAKQRVLLRSGTEPRQQFSAANFMRAWDNADRWALVLLQPGQLPAQPRQETYFEAVSAFERVASPHSSHLAWEAAIGAWPAAALGWVGRGTARYRAGDLAGAATDYAHAIGLDPQLAGARNNLAMTLLELGCPAAARRELDRIGMADLGGALREAVQDTARQIQSRATSADRASCSALY